MPQMQFTTVEANHALSHKKASIVAGIVNSDLLTPVLMFVSLRGSVLWVNFCSHLSIPVSTTHVAGGAIIGTGTTRGAGLVKWGDCTSDAYSMDHYHPLFYCSFIPCLSLSEAVESKITKHF